jgi:hypothetical protein
VTPVHVLRSLLRGKVEGQELIVRLRMANNPTHNCRTPAAGRNPADERAYWTSRLERELTAWTEIVDQHLAVDGNPGTTAGFLPAPLGEDIVRLRARAVRRHPFAPRHWRTTWPARRGREWTRFSVGAARPACGRKSPPGSSS